MVVSSTLAHRQQLVWEALKTVIDPELSVNIVDLGLIYRVEIQDQMLRIVMTLTTPGCPLASVVQTMVEDAVRTVPGCETIRLQLELSFDPPWVQDMMSEEAKAALGFA